MFDVIINLINYIVPFMIVLTLLVFVHEMGHYLIARINSVKVEVFSIGFGPELFGFFDGNGTRWRFSLIPLGGYVKFLGDMGPASMPNQSKIDKKSPNHDLMFHNKTIFQRASIVVAGPLANFILSIIIFSFIFLVYGKSFSLPIINEILPNSAAERYGLKERDTILSVGRNKIKNFEDLRSIIQLNPNIKLKMNILRDGKVIDLIVIPSLVEIEDNFGNKYKIGQLGVRSNETEYIKLGFIPSLLSSIDQTYSVIKISLVAIKQILFGKRSTDELAGVIGIAKMTGDVAQVSIIAVLQLMAFLSISLGLVNLFPIPLLDGGHLLFYIFEAILGRPLSIKVQEFGMKLGLIVVIFLFLLTTVNDLSRVNFFNTIYRIFS
ncbi:MAG: RIP metalloprotease RseP [Rhodospirillaceae bacterium]|mgnify:CR=1 FL=1|nr:RIP metalloprotease RseP [Rhodospirillaceae bacterium]|tara:strand:- start:2842 stop:3978 length:1137 start_codon:yes stop_codon:yes gene_type:complete